MNSKDNIVASGGWFTRVYRTKPVALLIASAAYAVGTITGILAISVVVLWHVDGVIPVKALYWTLGGLPVTALLIVITRLVARREKERTLFNYQVQNPNRDARKLY